jgi:hypothetical protein
MLVVDEKHLSEESLFTGASITVVVEIVRNMRGCESAPNPDGGFPEFISRG